MQNREAIFEGALHPRAELRSAAQPPHLLQRLIVHGQDLQDHLKGGDFPPLHI